MFSYLQAIDSGGDLPEKGAGQAAARRETSCQSERRKPPVSWCWRDFNPSRPGRQCCHRQEFNLFSAVCVTVNESNCCLWARVSQAKTNSVPLNYHDMSNSYFNCSWRLLHLIFLVYLYYILSCRCSVCADRGSFGQSCSRGGKQRAFCGLCTSLQRHHQKRSKGVRARTQIQPVAGAQSGEQPLSVFITADGFLMQELMQFVT